MRLSLFQKIKGEIDMLKELFWDAFKKSGNIEAYIFYKELDEHHKREENKNLDEVKSEIS